MHIELFGGIDFDGKWLRNDWSNPPNMPGLSWLEWLLITDLHPDRVGESDSVQSQFILNDTPVEAELADYVFINPAPITIVAFGWINQLIIHYDFSSHTSETPIILRQAHTLDIKRVSKSQIHVTDRIILQNRLSQVTIVDESLLDKVESLPL